MTSGRRTELASDRVVTEGFASVNGLRLHYREWPNEGAPTLLLLHGFAGHARMWDSFADALGPGHRIVALDARGHGESDRAADYSSARHIEDLSGFVDDLGLHDLTIVGFSNGSWIARRWALQRPRALTRLILVDEALPDPDQPAVWPTSVAPPIDVFDYPEVGIASFVSWLTSLAAGPESGSDAAASAREWDHYFRWNLMTMNDGRFTWRWDPRMLLPRPAPASAPQLSYQNMAAQDWRAFSQVNVPVLVIRGGLSRRLAPEILALMAERFPNVRSVEVAGAGHHVPFDEPRGFCETVEQFLARSTT